MSRLGDDVWGHLAESQPRGAELIARLALPDLTERLLAGVDAAGRRHLLVPLESGDEGLRDVESRGLWATTSDLSIRGEPPRRYIDLICNDPTGHEALDVIGGELGQRLALRGEAPAAIVGKLIAKWRRFWGQLPRDVLSKEAQLGLFAELWFLRCWLLRWCTATEAVNRWRGPWGSRHDFEWQGRSVEVKATSSTRGIVHVIHGIDQLAPPESGDLLLYSLRLREEGGAPNSLPNLIARCREDLAGDDEALARFDTALAQAHYSPAHDEEYEKLKLRVVGEGLYAVEGDFPRLTVDKLGGTVPAGVEQVDYIVNLGGFAHHLIAAAPDSASF